MTKHRAGADPNITRGSVLSRYHRHVPMEDRTLETDATLPLLRRARDGDADALDRLIARYIPSLERWAHGRLPGWARGVLETGDLVQEAAIQVFKRIGEFDYRGEGSLHAYLRQATMNRIRNEIRAAGRRPASDVLDDGLRDPAPSPLDLAMGAEALDRYEAALARLRPEERELIIGRAEIGLTYPELADATGKSSPDAARMAVARALVRLAEEMDRDGVS